MMALLLEPLQFTFMSHALLISLVVSIPCALLSVFLVLKGWALMGDAMSHAVFPGIVLAWILGLPLATGAFVAGVFCAVATGYLKDNSRIKQDTVMGIVFSGMFAAGLILYIAVKPDVHLEVITMGYYSPAEILLHVLLFIPCRPRLPARAFFAHKKTPPERG